MRAYIQKVKVSAYIPKCACIVQAFSRKVGNNATATVDLTFHLCTRYPVGLFIKRQSGPNSSTQDL